MRVEKTVSPPEKSLGRLSTEDINVSLELLVLTQSLGRTAPGHAVVRHLALHQPHEPGRGQLQHVAPHPVGLGVGHDPGAAPGAIHQTGGWNIDINC